MLKRYKTSKNVTEMHCSGITWMSKWTSLVKTLGDLSIAMIFDCKRMNARQMLKQTLFEHYIQVVLIKCKVLDRKTKNEERWK